MQNARVLFDHGPLDGETVFKQPSDIIRADAPTDLDRAFNDMQLAQSNGKWLAGYLSYEYGYLLSSKLVDLLPRKRGLPLIEFGVFDGPVAVQDVVVDMPVRVSAPKPVWTFENYERAFDIVHAHIVAGDVYQINLTFPLISRFAGTIEALYSRLRQHQPVLHGALVQFGSTCLLSRSPELFFSLSAKGELITQPMKGTAPRGRTTAEDDARRTELQLSAKNRAENVMIVDLLRNDMSRISEIGSVVVTELFAVERYATLHQMTSIIKSQTKPGLSLKEIFNALFPCGSIIGAPKVRAMQIIRKIEPEPRSAYCGSIGWIAPDGRMEFNVAIRTLQIQPDRSFRLDVGGGVVYDSTAKDEYAEALLKSKFVGWHNT